MKLLITGHQGYLGRVMARFLQQRGHSVVGLDTGFYEDSRFGPVVAPPKSITGDTRDVSLRQLKGFDALVHLAALSNDPIGELDPAWTDQVNHKASVSLAQLARDAGITRFLFSSSCSMYGANADEVSRITHKARNKRTLLRVWSNSGSHFLLVNESPAAPPGPYPTPEFVQRNAQTKNER